MEKTRKPCKTPVGRQIRKTENPNTPPLELMLGNLTPKLQPFISQYVEKQSQCDTNVIFRHELNTGIITQHVQGDVKKDLIVKASLSSMS